MSTRCRALRWQRSTACLSERLPAPALAELRARAFIWLGNAHRLACDFRAAESAFSAAGAVLALLDPAQAPIGRAEYLDRKAALRWLESRYDQAHELATQAPPFSSACSPDQQARMALQRAEIEAAKGDLRASCATLEAVSKRLVMVEDRHLSSVAWLNLTFRYIELGDLEPAQGAVQNACAMPPSSGDRSQPREANRSPKCWRNRVKPPPRVSSSRCRSAGATHFSERRRNHRPQRIAYRELRTVDQRPGAEAGEWRRRSMRRVSMQGASRVLLPRSRRHGASLLD